MAATIWRHYDTIWWALAILVVYVAGLFVPVMEVDAAQYASMSREMLHRGDFLHLYNRGQDYLDKPPLLFWLVSLSYWIWGVSTVAFKLPSLLFSLLAIYSTYRLGERLHSATVGLCASFMLATSQAWFMMNVDPRTDTLLAGSVTFALWQLVSFDQNNKMKHLLLGSLGIGLAMLAKGPIGLMVPGLALVTHWLIRQEWRSIFRWHWLYLLGVVALLLLPMAYGLYTQFDLHPEKEVYGLQGISGLKFYFWDQSFGRLTGDSPFVNQVGHAQQASDPFFFVHTFLWSFFPWSWLFIVVCIRTLIIRINKGWQGAKHKEYITWAGTLLPWIALSFSGYKLPHYIFVFYPLAAILTAKELQSLSNKRWLLAGQYVVAAIAGLVVLSLLTLVFPQAGLLTWIGLLVGIVGIVLLLRRRMPLWLSIGVGSMILLNWTINSHFYPKLLTYQVPGHVALHASTYGVEADRLYQWPYTSYNFEFYRGALQDTTNIYTLAQREAYVLVADPHWSNLQEQGVPYRIIHDSIPGTRVTRLTGPFLYRGTRADHLQRWRIIQFISKE